MIGILNAYRFEQTQSYQKEYSALMLNFVKRVFPGRDIKAYEIPFGEWPADINECDLFFITGSPKAAYDSDPWIQQLKDFIVKLHANKKKLIGICFGHQIIAAALGGQVIKSPKGWGVGIKNFKIIKIQPWMKPQLSDVKLLFSHQDQVVQMPREAILIAQDSFCEQQMYQIGNHILTMQGHPEFSDEFAKERLNTRKDLVGAEVYQAAMNSYDRPKDNDVIIEWIRNFAQIE